MQQLSDRTEEILALCRPTDCIADIGCDHGYVACELKRRGIARRVIATDISAASLSKAAALAARMGINIEKRTGDGLFPIEGENVNAAVIAGMGGELISSIINRSERLALTLDYMVLCPHTHPEALRATLCDSFTIERETMVHECGHFYTIMLVVTGGERLSQKELLLGKHIEERATPVLAEYMVHKKALLHKKHAFMREAGKDISQLETQLGWYEEALICIKENLQKQ